MKFTISGMLLERIFKGYLIYTVTSVINPKGTYKLNFGRVDEQIFFVVPDLGYDVIAPRPRNAKDETDTDHLARGLVRKLVENGSLTRATADVGGFDQAELELIENALYEIEETEEDEDANVTIGEDTPPEYEDWYLRRRGQESSYRHQRPNQFFAINIDPVRRTIEGIGPLLARDEPYVTVEQVNLLSVYPIDNEGNERVWRYSRETMQKYIDAGEIVVGSLNKKSGSWTLNHRKLKNEYLRNKTVWWEKRHDAGVHGTNVVNNLLGKRGLFPFPKSVYAVQDALAAVVRNRPHALILDFFAGSGTTFHATCLLNAADGGQRRSVLVTNNEVEEKLVRELARQGVYRGDPEFEAHGIFSLVTRPRCEAVVTGLRPDGKPVPRRHINGRPFAQGFQENIEFFRIDYLDPDDVDLGNQFQAIFPSLWLAAGGVGVRPASPNEGDMLIPAQGRFAVLFQEDRFRAFSKAVHDRPDITHVWIVTDSEDAFAEMRAMLPAQLITSMLYRDYLRNFRINTRRST